MDRSEIEEKVIRILAGQLSIDSDKIDLESTIEGDLNADSLDLVEATLALEEEFKIELPEEEVDTDIIKTVQDVVDLVSSKLNA